MTMITDLPPCPVETTLLLISDKWVVLILRDLMTGTKRFNELMRSVTGVSQKVLTEKLRRMEENGLVIRTVYSEIPPKVEYSLTARRSFRGGRPGATVTRSLSGDPKKIADRLPDPHKRRRIESNLDDSSSITTPARLSDMYEEDLRIDSISG